MQKKKERAMCVCVYVCMCEREIERERGKERERKRKGAGTYEELVFRTTFSSLQDFFGISPITAQRKADFSTC